MASVLQHPENIERALNFLRVYADEVQSHAGGSRTYRANGRPVAQYFPNGGTVYHSPLLFIVDGLGF